MERNVPKIVATVIAIAIIATVLSVSFVPALPKEIPPIEVSDPYGDGISYSDGKFIVDQYYNVTSHMGKNIDDVYMDIYVKSPSGDYFVGDPGKERVTLKPGEPTRIHLYANMPIYLVMAGMADEIGKEDGAKTPIVAKLHFSYIEWLGDHISDVEIGVRLSDNGGRVTAEASGNDATMTCAMSDNEIMRTVSSKFSSYYPAGLTIVEPKSGAKITIDASGSTFTVKSTGTNGSAGADFGCAPAENGKVVLNFNGEQESVDEGLVDALAEMLDKMYEAGSR